MINCNKDDFYKIEEIWDLLNHMPFDVIAPSTVTNPGEKKAEYNWELCTGLTLHTSGNSYRFSIEANQLNPAFSAVGKLEVWGMSERAVKDRDRVLDALFRKTLSDMPLLINDEIEVIRIIAAWRLRIGR